MKAIFSRLSAQLWFILAVAACAHAQAVNPPSQRAIPDDNLGYPVLITLGNGSSGSGFYIDNGKDIFLVTAKHVFFDPQNDTLLDTRATLLSYSKDPADDSNNLFSLDLAVLQNDGNLKPHPDHDVAVIRILTHRSAVR
jgi:hypothetical protein